MSEQASASKPQNLRPILPARAKRPLPTDSEAPSKQSPRIVACNACHKGKYKCSGARPACSQCVRRRIQCQYLAREGETAMQALRRTNDRLLEQLKANEDLFVLLRNLPDKETHDVLQKIKSGINPTAIINHVRTGNVLLQMRTVPETRFRYEFPYRSEIPEDHVPNNPYLESMIYEAASLYSTDQNIKLPAPDGFSSLANLNSDGYQNLYLMPFHAAQVVDPLLTLVRISSWTTVSNDDMLMRDLLTVFLQCEYHFTAAFQKDYFLEDMAANRGDFCSSLLVNTVLAYACVCYPSFLNRAEYWNPHTLHYRFLAEAKRLWELEATEPHITTIQAGIIFNVIYNLSGLDEIGKVYLVHAIALAHEVKLFDDTMDGHDVAKRNGRIFTAWALYSWQALVAFSFMTCPMLKKPPTLPLPNPSENVQWYGEIWVRYPMTQYLVPSCFGHVFKARCHFRVIMNEFCCMAYSNSSKVTLDKANEFRSQLQVWWDGLPIILQPKLIVLPGHLQLHMYYHHIMLAIYEPLLDSKPKEETSPQQIVDTATKNLQTLVRLYYLRHGFEAMDLFIVIPLMLIAYKCVDAIDEQTPGAQLESLRSSLILVTKGLYNQCQNHYLARALFRVIRGRMRPKELSILRKTVVVDEDEAAGRLEMEQAVRSHWPVSVVKRKDELDSHILKNLVDAYARLNVE